MLSKIKKLFKTKKKSTGKKKKTTKKRTLKKAKKKISRKKKPVRKLKKSSPAEELVGTIIHFFPHVKAGVVKIKKGPISLGDSLHIKGHTTDFIQKINSMQIDRVPIKSAPKGKEIGIQVKSRVRHGDKVYKVK